ncbi:MAG TPA: NAD-dependent epimerase/dehydratase family protein [Planctomycetota bacterium]|jgi:UDP-glucose 4-epimerase|nr:NAD-dependent epimerase/dehydratase family protein [Planctomycetota bacterium]
MSPETSYRGRRVLVTGGLGFIGSNLGRRLVELGAEVTLMDSMIKDYGGNAFNIADYKDKVRVNIADVRDRSAMDHLVQGQDMLFNLAGQVSHIDSMRDPVTDLDINCRSQLSILESCRHNNPQVAIVFAASRQQYGRPLYLPVDEKHPVRPVDVNGINKTAGESYHLVYGEAYGLRAVSLRLTNTFGPGQLVRHNRQGFIGWFVRTIVEGGTIDLYGDGSQVRDLNFVDDVVEAFLLAGARATGPARGKVYNLAGPEPVSLKALVSMLIEIAGKGSVRCVPWPEDKKPIDIGDYYGSHALITEELGWEPRVALRDGLERTVRYYERHLQHYL